MLKTTIIITVKSIGKYTKTKVQMIKFQDVILLFALLNVFTFSSCVSHPDLLYFRREEPVRQIDPSVLAVQNYAPITIQTNDVLSITVRSFDQKLALPFNIAADQGGLNQSATPVNTYQVDETGAIDFPVLGKINLAGKTLNEAKDTINNLLATYLERPSINIRLLNFKISVLGEVRNPGMFSVSSDKITVLEALALAQDLTPYGNTQNVLVIREQDGNRMFGEINLQSTSFIKSEFFYLRQGDVVYVEPREDKQAVVRDNAAEYATLIVAGVQAVVSIATLIIISRR